MQWNGYLPPQTMVHVECSVVIVVKNHAVEWLPPPPKPWCTWNVKIDRTDRPGMDGWGGGGGDGHRGTRQNIISM